MCYTPDLSDSYLAGLPLHSAFVLTTVRLPLHGLLDGLLHERRPPHARALLYQGRHAHQMQELLRRLQVNVWVRDPPPTPPLPAHAHTPYPPTPYPPTQPPSPIFLLLTCPPYATTPYPPTPLLPPPPPPPPILNLNRLSPPPLPTLPPPYPPHPYPGGGSTSAPLAIPSTRCLRPKNPNTPFSHMWRPHFSHMSKT